VSVDPARPSARRPSYARHSRSRPPNDPLVEAVSRSGRPGGTALDVGAGSLNSTRYLLSTGFTVQAVDPDPHTAELAAELDDTRLTMHGADIQRSDLESVVHELIGGLVDGGMLCATFVGVHDTWARTPWRATTLRAEEMLDVMSDLAIVRYDELEYDGVNVIGQHKHWHTLRCLAQRP
jgi:hypothetical protein